MLNLRSLPYLCLNLDVILCFLELKVPFGLSNKCVILILGFESLLVSKGFLFDGRQIGHHLLVYHHQLETEQAFSVRT